MFSNKRTAALEYAHAAITLRVAGCKFERETRSLSYSGVSGMLADPDDSEGMANWAVEILRDDKRWEAVSRAARQRAASQFDQERIVDRYLDFYREVLAAYSGQRVSRR